MAYIPKLLEYFTFSWKHSFFSDSFPLCCIDRRAGLIGVPLHPYWAAGVAAN
jgi:hypothetical protein